MTERELSEKLGLSREALKTIRAKYQEGVHYERIPSKRPKQMWEVRWSENGYDALMKDMGFKVEEAVKVKEEPVFSGTGKVTGKFNNKRLIQCEVDGKPQMVLVRDSDFFVVGMEVPLRRDGERLVAARHPRKPGRW
jgi:hypothetical protein